MIDYLANLSEEQRVAVCLNKGYHCVVASAGSGKTRVLTRRYMWLHEHLDISPRHIVCITFTNKAANEMKTRIGQMLPGTHLPFICTFHALGLRILRDEIGKLDWPLRKVKIWDLNDVEQVLTRIYDENKINPRIVSHAEAKSYIHQKKLEDDGAYVSLFHHDADRILCEMKERAYTDHDKIYYLYLAKQRSTFSIDYNDMLLIPLYIFRMYPEVKERWAKQFTYIMVDEFQDVSDLNYKFCTELASVNNNLFVVGDPDQLIYSWRGAKMDYIMDFCENFPGAKSYELSTNYRSLPHIIDAANKLIAHNTNRIPKQMRPSDDNAQRTGKKVHYAHFQNREREAKYVTETISLLHKRGCDYSDIVVLYRGHDQARMFEEDLKRKGVPYRTVGQTPFYQTEEIKNVLAYLRLVDNGNDLDFERAITHPKRQFGPKSMDILNSYKRETGCDSDLDALRACLKSGQIRNAMAAEFLSLIDEAVALVSDEEKFSLQALLELVTEKSGLQAHYQTIGDRERLDNIADLKSSIRYREDNSPERITLSDYLDEIATYTTAEDSEVSDQDTVKLMTVHAAKGLQAIVVFVVAMNERIFPSAKAESKADLEEERRMAYVAFTRAEEELFISDAESSIEREQEEKGYILPPSRFILEAGYEDMHHVTGDLPKEILKLIPVGEAKTTEPLHGFAQGDAVLHEVYGHGVVTQVIADDELEICFDDGATEIIQVTSKLSHDASAQ